MIDGTIARKTNGTSKFGSRLDTIADLIFLVAVASYSAIHEGIYIITDVEKE